MRTRIIARSSLPRNAADDEDNDEEESTVSCDSTTNNPNTGMLSRRRLCTSMPRRVAAIVAVVAASSTPADARNLPVSNGADTSQVGTATAFVPILQLRQNLASLKQILEDEEQPMKEKSNSDGTTNELKFSRIAKTKTTFFFPARGHWKEGVGIVAASTAMSEIPFREQDFKRIFDAYSDPVSYKQKFLDANAFLVYYTNGYDGPGRAPLEGTQESVVNERQTIQFGTRNEAWLCWEDFVSEYDYYASSSRKTGATTEELESSYVDMIQYLSQTIQAVDRYIQVSSPTRKEDEQEQQ